MPLTELDPGWASALHPLTETFATLAEFLDAEKRAGHEILPPWQNRLRAFRQPLDDVRVLIIGQDPYPTPGHAMGLSFSVEAHVRPVPRSLANIYTEYCDDLGLERPSTGDLSPWARSGVLLLNRVLTVRAGAAGSHRGRGWEQVTDAAMHALAARDKPLVAILWGRDASTVKPLLPGVPTIESPHPSPLSAHRGFFGSKPFSRANALLRDAGAPEVDWRLP